MFEKVAHNAVHTGYAAYTGVDGQNKKADANAQGQNNTQGAGEAVTVKISQNNAYPQLDAAYVQKALDETQRQNDAFIEMLRKIFLNQGKSAHGVGFSLLKGQLPNQNLAEFISGLKPDQETIDKAKEAISEDGYYGVKKTSERILNFAKAIAGNVPEKIDEMREAVEMGFKAAKEAWGKELPAICKDTYDAVMKGFDDWKTSVGQTAAA